MAATGYTPIQLYRTATSGTAPSASNLNYGELAINYNAADMSLFAKNTSGDVIKLMNNPAGLTYPTIDGTAGALLRTSGAGVLSFSSVIFDNGTNVGIGTSSPTYKLDVQGTVGAINISSTTGTNAAYLKTSNTGGSLYVGRDDSTGSIFAGAAYAGAIWSSGAYPLEFFTNSLERMRIDSSGNVGIGLGNANPTYKLDVAGTEIRLDSGSATTTASLYIGGAANSSVFGYAGAINAIVTGSAAGDTVIGSKKASASLRIMSGNGALAATFDSSGNLGVGTASPSYKSDTIGTVRGYSILSSQISNPSAPSLALAAGGSLTSGTTYYIKLVALDGLGNATAPSSETSLTPSGSNLSITVSWSASTGAALYQVWYGTTAGAENKYYATTSTSLTLSADTGTSGTIPSVNSTGNLTYTGTLTGSTGIMNIGSGQLYKDANGQLGVGTTPTTVVSTINKSIQLSNVSILQQRTGGNSDLSLAWNALITSGSTSGTGYVYKSAGDIASAYEQNGAHRWYTTTTGGGSVGASISFGDPKMTLNSTGDLSLTNGRIFGWGNLDTMIYGSSATNSITFRTNVTDRMTLDASGNLGIGVTPSAWGSSYKALEVSALGNSIFGATTGGNTLVTQNAYYNGTNWISPRATASTHYEQTLGSHKWLTNSSTPSAGGTITWAQNMTLDSSGNLGVGAAAPSGIKLYTYQASGSTIHRIEAAGTALRAITQYFAKDTVGTSLIGTISVNGDYGVNGLMDINYAANGPMTFGTNNTTRMTISAAGVVTIANLAGSGSRAVNADASGNLSAASDSSLKQEVPEAPLPGLAEVLQIQPKAYKWLSDIENRGDEAAVEIGFFADQVAPIIPSAAPKGNDGLYGFYDRSVTAALVNAVKELKAELDSVKAELDAMKAAQ